MAVQMFLSRPLILTIDEAKRELREAASSDK
jgi:hypothetical protein